MPSASSFKIAIHLSYSEKKTKQDKTKQTNKQIKKQEQIHKKANIQKDNSFHRNKFAKF